MNALDFENAIANQVRIESGLAVGQVFWTHQTRKRPARPFIELTLLDETTDEHSEQRQSENPDVGADTFATADVSGIGPFLANSLVTAVVAGPDFNGRQFVIDATPSVPAVPWFAVLNDQYQTVVLHVGDQGEVTPSELATFFNAQPTLAAEFNCTFNGTDPITSGVSGAITDGGAYAADPLLFTNIDHPETTVEMTARTVDITGNSSAFALIKRIHRKLGSQRCIDALDPIAVVERGNVRNLGAMLENEYEGMATTRVLFRHQDENTETANFFKSTVVETTIETTTGTVVQTTTFE